MSTAVREVQYLTVQDMIWINQQVTKAVCPFHFMKLEEGTFYQYGYGGSQDILAQAKRFLAGFTKNAPFSEGNDLTARVACLSFLRLNGFDVDIDAEDIVGSAKPVEHFHPAKPHDVISGVLSALA